MDGSWIGGWPILCMSGDDSAESGLALELTALFCGLWHYLQCADIVNTGDVARH